MTLKLNFFKSSPAAKVKGVKKTPVIIIIAGFLLVAALSYILYIPPQKTLETRDGMQVGDIAGVDLTVIKDITVEDKAATEANRVTAVKATLPVYEFFARTRGKTEDLVMRWFNLLRTVRKDYIKNRNELANIKERIAAEFGMELPDNELKTILGSTFFSKADLNRLLQFINSLYDKRILTSRTGAKRSQAGALTLVSKDMDPVTLNIDQVYDLRDTQTALTRYIRDQDIQTRNPDFIASILMEFMDANISYSVNLTRQAEQQAAAAVNPVMIRLKTGKIILRKGDEVKPEDLHLLELITSAEERREERLSDFFLILVILGLLALFGGKFFKVWQSGSINGSKIFIVTAATLTFSALVYRGSLFLIPLILKNVNIVIDYDAQSIFFAIPFGVGALAAAFIFNLQSAVIFSFANAIISGIVCGWDFRIALFVLLGNLAVSYGIEYYQRLKRSPILKAGIVFMLPVNLITILVFNFTEAERSLSHISVDLVMGLIAAVIAPALATFIIPLWEAMFGLVTELKLIELTNLNLPIFREMLEKAPGTYHHSQMVASLSEAAASDLGLSPLLQTAMALYHDIGKIDNPHFFTENHAMYQNPHKKLGPRDSAKNIVLHIPDGMERANKMKLPPIVSSAITQHHGTKVVRFFYDKAREMSSVDSEDFEDNVFRYQGEKPKNVENAILMLADQVEAAAKSLASPTDEEIKNVIHKIVDNNVSENQFDECEGLTFKALNSIVNSFHKKLSSIYHMRISYPGFDFKEKKENGAESK